MGPLIDDFNVVVQGGPGAPAMKCSRACAGNCPSFAASVSMPGSSRNTMTSAFTDLLNCVERIEPAGELPEGVGFFLHSPPTLPVVLQH